MATTAKKKISLLSACFAHFSTIRNDQPKFVLWVLTSIVLALSTVWIPSLLGVIVGKPFFCLVMKNNQLIRFSVVFLSNSILNAISQKNSGTNQMAVTMRGIALVVTIMYLVFLSTIIPLKLMADFSLSVLTQFLLLVIALFIGIYIYGFRDSKWEKDVYGFVKDEDTEMENMSEKAKSTITVGSIKL